MATTVGNPPRPEELFAYAIVGRTLGVEIEHHDTGLQPAMVDGHFTCPDGRLGAIEVTTLAAKNALQTEAEVSNWSFEIPGLVWDWHVLVGPGLRRDVVYRHLSVLIPRCEQQRRLHLEQMNPLADLFDSYKWYIEHDIDVGATDTTSNSGRIFLVPGTGSGGAVPDGLDGFPAWLTDQLADQRFDSDLAKLNNSGCDDRHLFLRIHQTWLPFGYEYHVAWELTLPTEPFEAPAGLTGIWLATRWAKPILYWTAANGWARADYE